MYGTDSQMTVDFPRSRSDRFPWHDARARNRSLKNISCLIFAVAFHSECFTYIYVNVNDSPEQKQCSVHHVVRVNGHVDFLLWCHPFGAFLFRWIRYDDTSPFRWQKWIDVGAEVLGEIEWTGVTWRDVYDQVNGWLFVNRYTQFALDWCDYVWQILVSYNIMCLRPIFTFRNLKIQWSFFF